MYTRINLWTKRFLRIPRFTIGSSCRLTMSNDARQQKEVVPNAEAQGSDSSVLESCETQGSSAEARKQEHSSTEGHHPVNDALVPPDQTSVDGDGESDGTSTMSPTENSESTLEEILELNTESETSEHSQDLSLNTTQSQGGTVSTLILPSPSDNSSSEIQSQHSAGLSTCDASVQGPMGSYVRIDQINVYPGKSMSQDNEFPHTGRCSGSNILSLLVNNESTTTPSQIHDDLSNNATGPLSFEFSASMQTLASTSADESQSHMISMKRESNSELDNCNKKYTDSNNVKDALKVGFPETTQSEANASVLHESHSHVNSVKQEMNSELENCSTEDMDSRNNLDRSFSDKKHYSHAGSVEGVLDLSLKTGLSADGTIDQSKNAYHRRLSSVHKDIETISQYLYTRHQQALLNLHSQEKSQSQGIVVAAPTYYLANQDFGAAAAANFFYSSTLPGVAAAAAAAANVPFNVPPIINGAQFSPLNLTYAQREGAANIDPQAFPSANRMAEYPRPELEGCSGEQGWFILSDDNYFDEGEMDPCHLYELDVIEEGPLRGIQSWTKTRPCVGDVNNTNLNDTIPKNFKPPELTLDDSEETVRAAITQIDSTSIKDILNFLDKSPLDKMPGSLWPVDMTVLLLFSRQPPIYNPGDRIDGSLHLFLSHGLRVDEIKMRYQKEVYSADILHFLSRSRRRIWKGTGTFPQGHTVIPFVFQLSNTDHGDFFVNAEVGARYMVYMEMFGVQSVGLIAVGDFSVEAKPLSDPQNDREKSRDASGNYVSVSARRVKDRQLDLHVSIDRSCLEIGSDLCVTVEACEAMRDTGHRLQVFPAIQQTVTIPILEKKVVTEPVTLEQTARKLRYAKGQLRVKTFRMRVEGQELVPSHPTTKTNSPDVTIEHFVKVYVKKGCTKYEAVSFGIYVFPKELKYRIVSNRYICSRRDTTTDNEALLQTCFFTDLSHTTDSGNTTPDSDSQVPLVPVFELSPITTSNVTDTSFVYKALHDPQLWWKYAGVNVNFLPQTHISMLDDQGLKHSRGKPKSSIAFEVTRKMRWLRSNVDSKDTVEKENLQKFFDNCNDMLSEQVSSPSRVEEESDVTDTEVNERGYNFTDYSGLSPVVSDAPKVTDTTNSYLYLLEPEQVVGDKPLSAMNKKERKKWRKRQMKLGNTKEEKPQSKKVSGPKISEKQEEVSSCSALESDSNVTTAATAVSQASELTVARTDGEDATLVVLAKNEGNSKENGKAGETGVELDDLGVELDDLGFMPVSGKREKKKRRKQKINEETEVTITGMKDNAVEETENDGQRKHQAESQKLEGNHTRCTEEVLRTKLSSEKEESTLSTIDAQPPIECTLSTQDVSPAKADSQREMHLLDNTWPSLSEAALVPSTSFTVSASSTPRRNKSKKKGTPSPSVPQNNRDTLDSDRTLQIPVTPTSRCRKSEKLEPKDNSDISSKFTGDEENDHVSDVFDGTALPSPIMNDAESYNNIPQHKERESLDYSDTVKPETEMVTTAVQQSETMGNLSDDNLKQPKQSKKKKNETKRTLTDGKDKKTAWGFTDQKESGTVGERIEIRTNSENLHVEATAGSRSSENTTSQTEFVSQVGGESTTNVETVTEEFEPEVPESFVLDSTWPILSTEHRSVSNLTSEDSRGIRPSNSLMDKSWANALSAPKTQASARECQPSLQAWGATRCNPSITTETPEDEYSGWMRKPIKRNIKSRECSTSDNISKTATPHTESDEGTPQQDTDFRASAVIAKLEGRAESSTDVKDSEKALFTPSSSCGKSFSESLPSSWSISTDSSDAKKCTAKSLKTSSEHTSVDIPENISSRSLDKESCNAPAKVYPDVFLDSFGTTHEVENAEQQVDALSLKALSATTNRSEDGSYFPTFHDKKENIFTFESISSVENSEGDAKRMKEEKRGVEGSTFDLAHKNLRASSNFDRSFESEVLDSSLETTKSHGSYIVSSETEECCATQTSWLYTWSGVHHGDRSQRPVVGTDRIATTKNINISNTAMHQFGQNEAREREPQRSVDEKNHKARAFKEEENLSKEINRKYKERCEVEGRSYDARIQGAGPNSHQMFITPNTEARKVDSKTAMHEISTNKTKPRQTDITASLLQNEHTCTSSTEAFAHNEISKKSSNTLMLPTINEITDTQVSATSNGVMKATNACTDGSLRVNPLHYESSAHLHSQHFVQGPPLFYTLHNGNNNGAHHTLPPPLCVTAQSDNKGKNISQHLAAGMIMPKHNADPVNPTHIANVNLPRQTASSQLHHPNVPSFHGRSFPEHFGYGSASLYHRDNYKMIIEGKNATQSESSLGIQNYQINERALNNFTQSSHFGNPRTEGNTENVSENNGARPILSEHQSEERFYRRRPSRVVRPPNMYFSISDPWDVRRSFDICKMRSGIWSLSEKNIWANAKDVFGDPDAICACPHEFRKPPEANGGYRNARQNLESLAAKSTLNPKAPIFSYLNPNAPSFQSNNQARHFNPNGDSVDKRSKDGLNIVRNLNGLFENIYGSNKVEILEKRMRHVEQRLGQQEAKSEKSTSLPGVSEVTKLSSQLGRSHQVQRERDSIVDSTERLSLARPLHPLLSGIKKQSAQDSGGANKPVITALCPGLTPAPRAFTARQMQMIREFRNEQDSLRKKIKANWPQVHRGQEDTTNETGFQQSLQKLLRQQLQSSFQHPLQRPHDHEDLTLKENAHTIHNRQLKRQPEIQTAQPDSSESPTHPFRRTGTNSRINS